MDGFAGRGKWSGVVSPGSPSTPQVGWLALALLLGGPAGAVVIDWTQVYFPNNTADGTGYGAVGPMYKIGTYEVTNAQYAEFLNAVAAADPLALYNTSMGSVGITRSGVSGSYSYSAVATREDMPVAFVSFWDALRFANWLHNGQGAGDTETGAYTLLGGTPYPSNETVTRNAEATVFLTSEDEWYKAAYHNALAATDYFAYPAGSSTQTTCSPPPPPPSTNRANCYGFNSDYTQKGSYVGSASPAGTFDQGGNVSEWNEGIIEGNRSVRGGNAFDDATSLAASIRAPFEAGHEHLVLGFRVATNLPEPGTGLLQIAGLLGLACLWKRSTRPF